MKTFTIDMSVDYKKMGCEEPKRKPILTGYILSDDSMECSYSKTRPAIIVCPGGGYNFTSPREADPIALSYVAAGFHAFVIDYSCAPAGWPAACCEIAKAIAYVRDHAEEYHIDKIILCGFSAGGHAAASAGVHYNNPVIKEFAEVDGIKNKPDGLILGYPVITDELEKTHMGTYNNFCLGTKDPEKYFGLEHFVNSDTPKSFIWHTFEDPVVPVENSMKFANALVENKVSCELHIFPKGSHGLSLADKRVVAPESIENCPIGVNVWMDMSIRWIENL